ncbi:receptor-type tyrosine-protein phosphatase F isoform X1 [Rhipicephalus microplus]|uniref:receptor-type tyrosine-protein phosphatase F isoform X1 n=1 Tax=Rhipicephalus microplus TaxID=6941 RepID=UPI002376C38D
MMRFAVIAACSLLVLTTMGHTHEEKDLICNDSFVPATSVCDGTLDCSELDDISNDESPHICAPLPYLEWEASLAVHNVTSTSVQLSWTMTTANDSEDSLLLAGYFLTGKSEGRSFQNTISGRLLSHPIQWLKPWTDYTFILRPFYTETGRPHRQYKVGKAASAQIRTLSSVPEVPSLVSVVSAQPRNVVLSIVGPSAWNCAPVGFNLQWEATSESRGPRGSMEAPLTEDWSPEENTFNVTLPLRGGTDYRISVRATGTNSHGDKVWGPDLEIEVSVTLGSYDIWAHPVGSSKAVISWRASQAAENFVVTVHKDLGNENFRYHASFEFDGTGKTSSRYTALINDLEPWKRYEVTLQGCSQNVCSDSVSTTFDTLPEDFPRPALTKVAATSSSSFEVAWTFPQDDTRLYKGFQVLYCPTNQDICTVLYTTENSVTVSGLAPNSAFNIYVQAQLTNFDGRPILGPAAKASITTWNNLPMLHTKYAATIQESNDCLLQWTCYNSTIDYFQYKTRTDDSWTTCKNTADCDVTFFHERRVTSTSGYIRFGHEAQYGYGEVFVRGCNGNGCGPESSTYVPAVVTGPSRLSAVSVTPEGERAHVSWLVSEKRVYDGIEVVWNCSTTEAVFNIRLSKRTYGAAAPLYVPSENAEKCTFNASTYLDNQNGATYYSTPVQATQKGIVH